MKEFFIHHLHFNDYLTFQPSRLHLSRYWLILKKQTFELKYHFILQRLNFSASWWGKLNDCQYVERTVGVRLISLPLPLFSDAPLSGERDTSEIGFHCQSCPSNQRAFLRLYSPSKKARKSLIHWELKSFFLSHSQKCIVLFYSVVYVVHYAIFNKFHFYVINITCLWLHFVWCI